MVGGAIGCICAYLALRWGDRMRQPVWALALIMVLMVVAALQLLVYDGGFEATAVTAPVLGVSSLLIAGFLAFRRWRNWSAPR